MQGPPPEDVFLRLEHVPILDVCVQEFRDKEHYLNTRQMTCVWKPQVNTPKLNNNKMPSYMLISSVLFWNRQFWEPIHTIGGGSPVAFNAGIAWRARPNLDDISQYCS